MEEGDRDMRKLAEIVKVMEKAGGEVESWRYEVEQVGTNLIPGRCPRYYNH